MILQKQLVAIFATSQWIQLVSSSVELLKVDDPNDIQIAKKLVKYLESKINVIPKIKIGYNEIEEGDANEGPIEEKSHKPTFNRSNTETNKILIKRIVPHGLQVSKLKHDWKYNTLYKPLYRVHKGQSQNPVISKGNVKDFENRIKLTYIPILPDVNDAENLNPRIHNNEYVLQPFKHNLKWHQMKSKQGYDDAGNYLNFLLKYFNLRAEDIEQLLRSPSPVKSGEEEVPSMSLAPVTPSTTTPKPRWLPKYPAWNYWTYEKHIYQDACPGMLINVGGVCTRIPPHK